VLLRDLSAKAVGSWAARPGRSSVAQRAADIAPSWGTPAPAGAPPRGRQHVEGAGGDQAHEEGDGESVGEQCGWQDAALPEPVREPRTGL